MSKHILKYLIMKTLLRILEKTLMVYLLSLIFQAAHVNAQTDIPAGKVSGTWTLANSPYRVNGHITVPNDSTLNIEPGVLVLFTGSYKLDVKGCVLAVGTITDTITFTAENPSTGWQAVKFLNTASTNDSSRLIYCKMEYGKLNQGDDIDRCGGAIVAMNFSKFVISHCLLQKNLVANTGSEQSGYGGAIALWNASPKITDNTIINNQSTGSGGGGAIMVWDNSNPLIKGNLISKNTGNLGGGIYVGCSAPVIVNNIITENRAAWRGGGVHCYNKGNPVLINNTIVNNWGNYGGGLDCNNNCKPIVINSILYGNTATHGNQVTLMSADCDPDFANCLIEGGKGKFADVGAGANYNGLYENNLSCNPGFVDPEANNFSLSDTSYCISAGADSVKINDIWYFIPATDYTGNPRPNPSGTKPDIGALENILGYDNPVTPETNIPAGNVSGTWTFENSPYKVNGEITIPNGETLTIEPGVQVIFGGYYKFNIKGRLLAAGTKQDTIIFTSQNSETGWNGLRFRHTPATNDSSKIVYCRLQYGFTSINIDSCGGAIMVEGFDKLRISNCLITHNRTSGDPYTGGAGIGISACSPLVENNTFCYNNAEGGHGGAIFIYGASNSLIRNNLIYKNQAFGGGGIAFFMTSPILINNTISENTGTSHGGSSCIIACSPKILNTIIFGNDSPIGKQFHFQSGGQAVFHNCDIEGGKSAFAREFAAVGSFSGIYENNIETDPLFEDAENDDFHLADESPCISKAADSVEINGVWYSIPETDFTGNLRPYPVNTTPDIGAIENRTGYLNPVGIAEWLRPAENTFQLFQNYPNPFHEETVISLYLPEPSEINLSLFDALGRKIGTLADKALQSGEHSFTIHAGGLSEGIYFYRLEAGDYNSYKMAILIE
jgi:hypothetical protein